MQSPAQPSRQGSARPHISSVPGDASVDQGPHIPRIHVLETTMFVDRVTIFVRGGDGGNGCLSFRREKYAPRGGPNGGDGGHGGNVILRASDGCSNLAHLSHQRHWKAHRGEHGQGSDCFGKNGEDITIEVPAGTIVRDRDRGHVLRDLKRPDETVVVARGGRGGHGNSHFKSSTNRAPRQHEK